MVLISGIILDFHFGTSFHQARKVKPAIIDKSSWNIVKTLHMIEFSVNIEGKQSPVLVKQ